MTPRHLILTFAFTTTLSAQTTGLAPQPRYQSTGPTGSVTGIVIDQETQRPVRLAQVFIQSATPPSDDDRGSRFNGSSYNARTGLDGTFTLEAVTPGDYYALAADPGYIPESSLLQSQFNAGAKPDDLLRQIPTVHVTANGNATVNISIQHGGIIAGRIQWEDGTPACSVQVSVEAVNQTQPMPFSLHTVVPFGNRTSTADDRGNFRVSGLVTGDYILSANISPVFNRFNPSPSIRIYAPGVFRKTEAKPISVRIGDDRSDTRLVLDLSTLRKVSGHIGSATSGTSVRSGSVTLQDSVDNTLRPSGNINANGDFTIANIPPGTYTLTAQGSSQERTNNRRPTSNDPATSFQPATQPITIGTTDITGIAINLNPTTTH